LDNIYKRDLLELKRNKISEERLSIIIHDIINPFNSILGCSELLHYEYDNLSEEERKECIGGISSSATYYFHALKSLLKWLHFDQKGSALIVEAFDSSELVIDALSPFRSVRLKNNIEIVFALKEKCVLHSNRQLLSDAIGIAFIYMFKRNSLHQIMVDTEVKGEQFEFTLCVSLMEKSLIIDKELSKKTMRWKTMSNEKSTELIICDQYIHALGGALHLSSNTKVLKLSLRLPFEK